MTGARPASTGDIDQLVDLIQRHGASTVLAVLAAVEPNGEPPVLDGVDLTGWECIAGPGAIAFGRARFGPLVLVISVPERDRGRWEPHVPEITRLLLQPGLQPQPQPRT